MFQVPIAALPIGQPGCLGNTGTSLARPRTSEACPYGKNEAARSPGGPKPSGGGGLGINRTTVLWSDSGCVLIDVSFYSHNNSEKRDESGTKVVWETAKDSAENIKYKC